MADKDSPDKMSDSSKENIPTKPKKQTIEKIYQKKSQLEHILLRPDSYIGSVELAKETMWVYDTEKDILVRKEIEYVPGLYKIFDEILVNAADNKQRDKNMNCIKININSEENVISIWNNGKGIPVTMHKEENMFVPTMIFGHLLTSSNYNDEEEKVTGGRNGFGAKLCNIFSTKFVVETASKEYKNHFKQTWTSNMTRASEPKLKPFFGEDFTKITFSPDLAKFKMSKLDDDIVGLMYRRAFDVAASTRGVKVFLNDKKLPIKNFKDYVDLYVKDKEDDSGNPLKVLYENVNERWEVAFTISQRGYQQVSFVNSIATTKGGRHVEYVTDMITKHVMEIIKKKNKSGAAARPFQVKNYMWIFINCLIVNPTFDSQTKENMTLQMKNFGSKCNLSEKFLNAITKSGLVECVLQWAKGKAENELCKTSGKKRSKLNIPKLEDANQAGTKDGIKCTLILTEGDSAKTVAVAGLGVVGRDYYGVFPLRGKLLNVREATHKQILENAEINHLIKILGLQYKKKYDSLEAMKTLRYGKVMIMTDQDQDGSHIKGLLINFIHHNWPDLLEKNFLEQFITPIVKARKRDQELSFYSLPEYEEWKSNTSNHQAYKIKYYKGLGTSDSKEAKQYFSNMARHKISFRYSGQQDDDHIVMAFSKKHVDHRKEWLTNFMVESKRRKEIGLSEKYLYTKDTKYVSYTDFVNLELVLFSNGDNVRSIPSLVDGLKPGQRKVLFTCFKRNDKREVKVAQLSGSVAEHSAYHHGEASLCMTIVNLAQNFVGSNNINLLEPRGQFGTRLSGGKDSASPRYIFTKMSPLTRKIFHPADDPLLKHEYEDNQKIEPQWYIPLIPMILVNGADGIGTGWMTKIPNYNPREIMQNLRRMLDDEEPLPMIPWYKNFIGVIEDCGDHRYVTNGEAAVIGNNTFEITELPIGTWTQNFKENVLEPYLHGSEKVKPIISDYKNYSTDTTVKFIITCVSGQLENLEKEGIHKHFKLQTLINTGSMCVFDELGCLRRFDSVMDILKEFYTLRLKMYKLRKGYLEGMLEAEASKLSNQARFIMEKCSGELVVENKKRKTIVDELIKRQYAPDPVKEWKTRVQIEEESDEGSEDKDDEESGEGSSNKKLDKPEESADVKKFDYLLGLTMWMLTDERKNELLAQRDTKLAELEQLRRKTPKDLWREDLDVLYEQINIIEEKEKAEAPVEMGKVKKGAGGKKKINLMETMPSPAGRRIVPINDDIKKKIQVAVKAKENKGKRGVKKENIADEKDEFDTLTQSHKTLKDKIGTPEDAEKKGKAKKLKQTKLDFKLKSDDDKGKKRRKKSKANSDDDSFNSDDSDFESLKMETDVVRERTTVRRAATKPIKYSNFGSEDSSDNESQKMISSESEAEVTSSKQESSEDLFDSLVGKKDSSPNTSNEKEPKPVVEKRRIESSDSDFNDSGSDFAVKKPSKPKKKKKVSTSDGELSDIVKKQPVKPKKKVNDEVKKRAPAKPKAKKKGSDSDEFEIEKEKLNMKGFSHDDDSDVDIPKPTRGGGRAKKPTKYTFDSESSNSE